MPSKKAMRVGERRRLRNKPVRTYARSRVAAARTAIADVPDAPETAEAVRSAVQALAKAAQKGVVHRNNAARRVSRLMKRANEASTAQNTN